MHDNKLFFTALYSLLQSFNVVKLVVVFVLQTQQPAYAVAKATALTGK